MFEESRFDPRAKSFAGAIGLMQVMPQTGKAFGFPATALILPDSGTHAGVMYLRHVHGYIKDGETPDDQLWFALAAYNAGFGHLDDARRLTSSLGGNPNVWFGGVEQYMPLLAQRKYHDQSKYGYCRCSEPVNYVRRIRERERAYRRATDAQASVRSLETEAG